MILTEYSGSNLDISDNYFRVRNLYFPLTHVQPADW